MLNQKARMEDDLIKNVMLAGNLHKNGTFTILAKHFRKSAEKAGHPVDRSDFTLKKITHA